MISRVNSAKWLATDYSRWAAGARYSFSTTVAAEKCPHTKPAAEIPASKSGSPAAKTADPLVSAEEYRNARPYESIPGPSFLKMVYRMAVPGGKYFRKDFLLLQQLMLQEFGNVIKFPGMFGRPPIIMLFKADEIEKVFRHEGQWPYRRGLEVFAKFREEERPDLYPGMGGLLQE